MYINLIKLETNESCLLKRLYFFYLNSRKTAGKYIHNAQNIAISSNKIGRLRPPF